MLRSATRLLPVAILSFTACASWFTRGEPPVVLVTYVTPLEACAFDLRLKVDLRIRNPIVYEL